MFAEQDHTLALELTYFADTWQTFVELSLDNALLEFYLGPLSCISLKETYSAVERNNNQCVAKPYTCTLCLLFFHKCQLFTYQV